jgi:hypothetical protein
MVTRAAALVPLALAWAVQGHVALSPRISLNILVSLAIRLRHGNEPLKLDQQSFPHGRLSLSKVVRSITGAALMLEPWRRSEAVHHLVFLNSFEIPVIIRPSMEIGQPCLHPTWKPCYVRSYRSGSRSK